MDTRDLELDGRPADRLAVVKTLGADFLERRTGDRVGLILFGTRAYLQAPLTFDRATVATLLDEAVTGLAGERTAIGDAIALAIKRLREVEAEQRVLVLLTDGANTAGSVEPLEAARMAATAGLTIHTIGVGAERMVVDGLFGRREINPSAELDEALLRDVSSLTGGRYFRAASTAGLDDIYRLLDRMEPVPRGGVMRDGSTRRSTSRWRRWCSSPSPGWRRRCAAPAPERRHDHLHQAGVAAAGAPGGAGAAGHAGSAHAVARPGRSGPAGAPVGWSGAGAARRGRGCCWRRHISSP
ncbi:MAG: VWA domain-containing protein [Gammaproteobacteria bacterium]|nr:VWA domain-containing protein [Gammaproteobacteria bacterium]